MHDENAGHQAWLKRWLGEPVIVSVTYQERWWEDDEDSDPHEDSGFVGYTFEPNPCVKGLYFSTDHLWGEDFAAWWDENRRFYEYEMSVADAAQLCADWGGELYDARNRELIEEGEYEQDYRTGHWTKETLHVNGPADKVEAVFTLMDEIRARRWSPMDLEVYA